MEFSIFILKHLGCHNEECKHSDQIDESYWQTNKLCIAQKNCVFSQTWFELHMYLILKL